MISINPSEHASIPFEEIPRSPGVYLYRDVKEEIIYVGKAKSLRNRVRSYFSRSSAREHSPKTIILVRNIRSIEWIVVDTEVEALLLENKLIKRHTPKYNISLKDAKTYAYISITDEKFPRILSTRAPLKKGMTFGPYTDGSARAELVRLTVQLFKLRTCKTLPKQPCLNYHIGICTAPCIAKEIGVDELSYGMQVAAAQEFLKGDVKPVLQKLTAEMKEASVALKFEQAREKHRQIEAIHNLHDGERQKVDTLKRYDQDIIAFLAQEEKAVIELFTISKGVIAGKKEFSLERTDDVFAEFIRRYYSQNRIPREIVVNVPCWEDDGEKRILEEYLTSLRGAHVEFLIPERGEKRELVMMAERNAQADILEERSLVQLQEALNLSVVPKIIECFDISNLGTQDIVAGMTRFVDGKADTKGFRKFKIRTLAEGEQDDFRSMQEAVHRRYSRLVAENGQLPHLVIIDGGKGQLGAALSALQDAGVSIPIVALAKEREELFLPGKDEPLLHPKTSPMMLLVRSIRDRTHDFVLGYNRKRRQMRLQGRQ